MQGQVAKTNVSPDNFLSNDANVKLAFQFLAVATSGLNYKSFTVVIYNHNDSTIVIYHRNDSGQYYKTMIVANLALAWSVKYCKLKHTLRL